MTEKEKKKEEIVGNIDKASRTLIDGLNAASFQVKTSGELLVALACMIDSFIGGCAGSMKVEKEYVLQHLFETVRRFGEDYDEDEGNVKMEVHINPDLN